MHVSGDSFFLNESESGLSGTGQFGFVECGGDSMAYSMMPRARRRRFACEWQ
jgi:hypothetical protein